MSDPLDSLCGGRVSIALEVMIPMPHVYIMGGGHCGEALASTFTTWGGRIRSMIRERLCFYRKIPRGG